MLELLKNVARHRRLLRELVLRDLKARYVGSSMGFFWSVLYPIINLAIYSFVFRVVLRTRFGDKATTEETVLLMFGGILAWSAFAETIGRSTVSLVENSNLIKKVVFPSEVLSPALCVSSIVNMTIGLPLVLAGTLWIGHLAPEAAVAGGEGGVQVALAQAGEGADPGGEQGLAPGVEAPQRSPNLPYFDHEHIDHQSRSIALGAGLLALPLLVGLQMVFTIGLGYFLSAFNLLVRDTAHLIGVFVTVWMFATPIFYPPELVENAGFGWMLAMNPMHWLIASYREVLVYGEFPRPALCLPFAAVAFGMLGLGARFFRSQKDRFPDLL